MWKRALFDLQLSLLRCNSFNFDAVIPKFTLLSLHIHYITISEARIGPTVLILALGKNSPPIEKE